MDNDFIVEEIGNFFDNIINDGVMVDFYKDDLDMEELVFIFIFSGGGEVRNFFGL